MMRTGLARDRHAARLGLANEPHTPGGGHVLAVDVRAGFFREQNVARNDHLLARAWPAGQAERVVPVALVHHARADE